MMPPTMPSAKPIADTATPWYADGLQFACTGCGNCCTGGPGYIWISAVELTRLAKHLNQTVETVLRQYCRRIGDEVSLKEKARNARGEYDCVFLREQEITESSGGHTVTHRKRTCAIYAVRPLQCRTWPFWGGLLASPKAWAEAGKRCSGINAGPCHALPHIHSHRDATDWPNHAESDK